MDMRMSYEIKGAEELRRTLDKAGKGLEDFKKPLERCGIIMYQSISQNFASGGRPSWAGHAPLTTKLRGGGQILVDRGQLRSSVTSKGGAGSKYKLTKSQLTIGSNLKARGSGKLLAEIHQFGQGAGVHKVFGKPSKRGMPARPFLMIQDEDIPKLEKVFEQYIDEVMK
jgi:phage gpG-like protein